MLQRSLYEYENVINVINFNVIKILLFILNVQIEYKQEGLLDNITHGHTDCVDCECLQTTELSFSLWIQFIYFLLRKKRHVNV